MSTGSGRIGDGSQSACELRGTSARAALPRAARSAGVKCSTLGGAVVAVGAAAPLAAVSTGTGAAGAAEAARSLLAIAVWRPFLVTAPGRSIADAHHSNSVEPRDTPDCGETVDGRPPYLETSPVPAQSSKSPGRRPEVAMRRRLLASVRCSWPCCCSWPSRRPSGKKPGQILDFQSMVGVPKALGGAAGRDPRHPRRRPPVGRRLGEGRPLGRWRPRGQGQGPRDRSERSATRSPRGLAGMNPSANFRRRRELPDRRRHDPERASATRSRRRPGWAAATRRSRSS